MLQQYVNRRLLRRAPSPQRGEGWGEGAPTARPYSLTPPSPRWGEGVRMRKPQFRYLSRRCIVVETKRSRRRGFMSAVKKTLVIRNGTLIDGSGKPPARNDAIVVEGNRIKSVGALPG